MDEKTLISFDYAIKYLLRNKGDYDIVEGFISALLQVAGYGPVKINALLESESNREDKHLKRSIADLVVEDEKGDKYIVEIEREVTNNFVHKACFNSSRLIVDSISSNEDYNTIKKVFHISLLYFPLKNLKAPLVHGSTIFREVDTEHPLNLHLINMGGKIFDAPNVMPEYFLISIPLFDDFIRNEIDEWLYVMKNSRVKEDFKSKYMKKLAERLAYIKMNAEERIDYAKYVRNIITSRDSHAAAVEEGIDMGIDIGIDIGKTQLIKTMLERGKSVQDIANLTGLTADEVNELIINKK